MKNTISHWGRVAALGGCYFAFALFGLQFDPIGDFASLVWPPSGIALAALFLFGFELWPGIFLGAFFANSFNGAPVFAAAGIGLGSTLEAVIGAYLLRRVGFRREYDRLSDAQNFVLAIPIGAAAAALIGPISLLLAGIIEMPAVALVIETWWIGDILGIILVTPFLLTWWGKKIELPNAGYIARALLLAALFAGTTYVVFEANLRPAAYALLLPIVWAALRLGQRAATVTVLAVAATTIAYTILGEGPFVKETLGASLLAMQVFMAVGAAVSLLIGAVAEEQLSVEQKLRKHQNELTDFMDNAAVGIVWTSLSGRIRWANAAALAMLDRPAHECIGSHLRSFCIDQTAVSDMLRRLAGKEQLVDHEMRVHSGAHAGIKHVLISANMFEDEEGAYIRCFLTDITEKKRRDEMKTFLADVSIILTGTRTLEERLRELAHFVTGRIADWCIIDLIEKGELARKAVAHTNSAPAELMQEFSEAYPLSANGAHGVAHAIRSGKTEWYPELTNELIANMKDDARYRDALKTIGATSMLIVPLMARDKKIGVLTLIAAGSGRHYTADDRVLAEELGWRTAAAVDNARLLEESERASRAKDNFLSQMSHELRNPLAPMLSALELVERRESRDPELEEPLGILKRQTTHLGQLLNDLFDISLITRGKVALKQEWVEVRGVVQRSIEIVRPFINSREHAFFVSVPEKPLWMVTDPLRFEEIVVNLLNNAAKYTQRGGQIWLHCLQEDDMVVLRVRDTGIGIPGEAMPKIFAPFTKLDLPGTHPAEGLGIGLSLVKAFAELQGGSVSVRSEIGRGSEFTVSLPRIPQQVLNTSAAETPAPETTPTQLETAEPTRHKEVKPRTRKKELSKKRILLVDDNKDGASTLRMLLEQLEYEVRLAHTGAEALGAWREQLTDIVILDIGLPDMDGYAVARAIKQSGRSPALLIALTGYGQKEDENRSHEAGFDHHLTKPVSIGILETILKKI